VEEFLLLYETLKIHARNKDRKIPCTPSPQYTFSTSATGTFCGITFPVFFSISEAVGEKRGGELCSPLSYLRDCIYKKVIQKICVLTWQNS
jgi:hypothetical protein